MKKNLHKKILIGSILCVFILLIAQSSVAVQTKQVKEIQHSKTSELLNTLNVKTSLFFGLIKVFLQLSFQFVFTIVYFMLKIPLIILLSLIPDLEDKI